jgi:hypothetical protein
MQFPNQWKVLSALGLEFWLPLPVLSLMFWSGGGWMMQQAIERPYTSDIQLQASSQVEITVPVAITAIDAEIRREQGYTKVDIRTTNSNLKKLEYQFQVLEFEPIEAAIAEELGLPREQVQSLIRYEIKR